MNVSASETYPTRAIGWITDKPIRSDRDCPRGVGTKRGLEKSETYS